MGHPRIKILWSGFFLAGWTGDGMDGFARGAMMYFYWRIMEELKYLGEVLVFHDPSFKREYQQWIEKNQSGLDFSAMEDNRKILNDFDPFDIAPSLN